MYASDYGVKFSEGAFLFSSIFQLYECLAKKKNFHKIEKLLQKYSHHVLHLIAGERETREAL